MVTSSTFGVCSDMKICNERKNEDDWSPNSGTHCLPGKEKCPETPPFINLIPQKEWWKWHVGLPFAPSMPIPALHELYVYVIYALPFSTPHLVFLIFLLLFGHTSTYIHTYIYIYGCIIQILEDLTWKKYHIKI